MTVVNERLILESFAVWAEDYSYLKSLFDERFDTTQKEEEKNIFLPLFRLLENENFNDFERNEQIRSKEGMNKTPKIIETEHIRATIWKISDFEYRMRGYLKKLEWETNFFENLSQLQLKQTSTDVSIEGVKNKFQFGRKRNCIVTVSEIGLFEGFYYICEVNPKRKRQKIIQAFKRVLRSFNDGQVRELSNNQ